MLYIFVNLPPRLGACSILKCDPPRRVMLFLFLLPPPSLRDGRKGRDRDDVHQLGLDRDRVRRHERQPGGQLPARARERQEPSIDIDIRLRIQEPLIPQQGLVGDEFGPLA
jgi:hypothetical protein